jgi:hypothetical protein
MNGNVIYVGLNFQERAEEKHPKKEGNNGEANMGIHARALTVASEASRRSCTASFVVCVWLNFIHTHMGGVRVGYDDLR